jgi:hypothetical protein
MKNTLWLTPVLTLALFGLLCINGCNKGGGLPSEHKTASAEKNSFQQVTAQLEPGGNLYVYLSTEQMLEGLSGKMAGWRNLVDSVPNLKANDRENIGKAFDVVTSLVKASGVEDVSGFGMSSVEREKGVYHTRMLLHHYKGKGSGFLWTMFGQKPHAFEGLNLLPANTAAATFSDLDVPMLWSVVKKQVADAGFPQAEAFLNKLPDGFEKSTGLKWDKVLASLGGEFGFAVTLDDAKKITIPLPGGSEPLEIPEPALVLVAKIKDDTIFNRIDQALKQKGQSVVTVDKSNLKMRTMPLPLPLPIQLRPSVATSGGYLFIATTDAVIQEMLAVKAGQKPGLKSSDEFKNMARDVPQQGNGFNFVSQRFGETIHKIQQQALQIAASKSQKASTEWLQSLLGSVRASFSYTVSGNTEEGWLAVGNGNQHPAKVLLVGAVVPVGVLAAIAIPNFVKARGTAQKNVCINNLRQIDAAKAQWALENKKTDTDTPTRADLQAYLKQFPVCPAGGKYTIKSVSEQPECSIPGHRLGN